MSNVCSKCGNYVQESESEVGSAVMSGVKFAATVAAQLGRNLGYLPNGRIVGGILERLPDLLPTRVMKFKCSCGNSWTQIRKDI